MNGVLMRRAASIRLSSSKLFSSFAALAFLVTGDIAAAGIEGTYVLHQRETDSTLELQSNHRFRWYLSQGAMDVSAQGNWEEKGNVILLTTSPVVVPPRFELVGSGHDRESGLLIKIVDVHGKPVVYLDVFADSENGGEPDHGFEQTGEYRFRPRAGYPITSVRLGSEIFDFISKPFPVARDGSNVMTFRFTPNDCGKANFVAQPVTLAGGALTLKWRGVELLYER
jgi:hypothetical protein